MITTRLTRTPALGAVENDRRHQRPPIHSPTRIGHKSKASHGPGARPTAACDSVRIEVTRQSITPRAARPHAAAAGAPVLDRSQMPGAGNEGMVMPSHASGRRREYAVERDLEQLAGTNPGIPAYATRPTDTFRLYQRLQETGRLPATGDGSTGKSPGSEAPDAAEISSSAKPPQYQRRMNGGLFAALLSMTTALFGYGAKARADCPMGVPVPDAIPASSFPDETIIRPLDGQGLPLYGAITGVTSTRANGIVYAIFDSGIIGKYNFSVPNSPVLEDVINAGYPGAKGITMQDTTHFIISTDSTLYFGKLINGDWQENSVLGLDVGSVEDVNCALGGQVFIARAAGGIPPVRKVNLSNGTTTVVNGLGVGNLKALFYMEFLPDSYCNPAIHIEPTANVNFKNVDMNGNGWGSPDGMNLNSGTVQGITYIKRNNGDMGLEPIPKPLLRGRRCRPKPSVGKRRS